MSKKLYVWTHNIPDIDHLLIDGERQEDTGIYVTWGYPMLLTESYILNDTSIGAASGKVPSFFREATPEEAEAGLIVDCEDPSKPKRHVEVVYKE